MLLQRDKVETLRVVDAAADVADRDDAPAELRDARRGVAAHVAEALHDHAAVLRELEQVHHAVGAEGDAAPGGFLAPERAADAHRLARDDAGHGVAHLVGVGVHHPRHGLLVGAHVGRHHVGLRPDEGDHLAGVAARDALQLADGAIVRVDRDAALGPAIGQVGQRALPAHPHRQRGDLAQLHARVVTQPALGRPEGEVMLHAVALKDVHVAGIHSHGQRDGDEALGQLGALAQVVRMLRNSATASNWSQAIL